jgi:hypothetical protein
MTALLLSCGDSRIAPSLAALQDAVGAHDAHRLLVPGGPLVLTRAGMERRVALECIRAQLEVEAIGTVYLVSHQDCTTYERALGGLGFDHRELLMRDLHRVRALLENTFSGIDVQCYVIPWHENGDGAGFGPAELVE